jgi:hypothetical protein
MGTPRPTDELARLLGQSPAIESVRGLRATAPSDPDPDRDGGCRPSARGRVSRVPPATSRDLMETSWA